MNHKRMISLLLFLQGIAITLFLNLSCKKSPTEPEDNSTPGRRDYVWSADTIKTTESLLLSRIWGSSHYNIWAIGPSSWTATTIWHYNGLKWSCDSIPRNVGPWAIYGIDSNEVWLGNSNSTIWKYDGKNWTQFGKYNISGYDHVSILNFYGKSKNDIYGVGYAENYSNNNSKAIIIHYDGVNWKFVNIPVIKVEFIEIAIDENTYSLIISGWLIDENGLTGKLYIWNGKELKEIYSGADVSIGTINNKIYITINQKIYKYNKGNLELWMDKTGSRFIGKIWGGRSEKDFFWCSYEGIGHYNGTDFQTIYNIDLNLMCGYVFDKDVFFIYKDYNKTGYNVIVHGVLNEE
ncbi:MAG: hypothetical protein NTX22_07615 [Ignavibacteriales bacterium]|nr:hypothetical protein [Ignavibacteriales bacterium]